MRGRRGLRGSNAQAVPTFALALPAQDVPCHPTRGRETEASSGLRAEVQVCILANRPTHRLTGRGQRPPVLTANGVHILDHDAWFCAPPAGPRPDRLTSQGAFRAGRQGARPQQLQGGGAGRRARSGRQEYQPAGHPLARPRLPHLPLHSPCSRQAAQASLVTTTVRHQL